MLKVDIKKIDEESGLIGINVLGVDCPKIRITKKYFEGDVPEDSLFMWTINDDDENAFLDKVETIVSKQPGTRETFKDLLYQLLETINHNDFRL